MCNSRNKLISHRCSSLVPVSHHFSGGVSVRMGGWWMRSPKKMEGAGHTVVAPHHLFRVTEVSKCLSKPWSKFSKVLLSKHLPSQM